MMKYYNQGGDSRKERLLKISSFLQNPGRFALLVIGSRGTGKKSAIEWSYGQVINSLPDKEAERSKVLKDLCFESEKPHFISADQIPSSAKDLDKLLANHEHQTLVVSDIEKIGDAQELLFEALSTTNGKFGIEENRYAVRMVFTSSLPIDQLRTDQSLLTGRFWDRISQLVVTMPSYDEEPANVIKDFYTTWDKMSFEGLSPTALAKRPMNTKLQMLLEDNAYKLEGGFRDLDKVVVLYFNYRLLHYNGSTKIIEEVENKVVDDLRNDFWSVQLKKEEFDGLSVFRMDSQGSWPELEDSFKNQFYRWARSKYKTLTQIEKELKIPVSTFKGYSKANLKTRRESRKG